MNVWVVFRTPNGDKLLRVKPNADLRMLRYLLNNIEASVVYEVDPDGITVYLVFATRHKDIAVKQLLRGIYPPTPVITVRLWLNPDSGKGLPLHTDKRITYHHLAPLPAAEEQVLVRWCVLLTIAIWESVLTQITINSDGSENELRTINPSPEEKIEVVTCVA